MRIPPHDPTTGTLPQYLSADVIFRPGSARSPLIFLAAHHANDEVMSLLLAGERLPVNAAGQAFQTALFAAILEGKQGLVDLLLADPRTDINHRDRPNWGPRVTPRASANGGDEDNRDFAILHPESNTSHLIGPESWMWVKGGSGPMRSLGFDSGCEIAKSLLAADAKVNVNTTSELGHEHQHPLVIAAEERLCEVVEMLPQREDVDFSVLKCKESSFEDPEKSYGAATAYAIINHLAKARRDPVGPVV
ncbi:hypothetical protein HOY80DRAFT_1134883 [Tuber brumale]|nr:hypothetical protein HOY80DRAFT_1134883 [Tuber brumale]